MITFPNAKINLGLNIIRKREDGFHDLESCFYPVNWTDILEIIPSDELKFTSSGIAIPGNPDSNLCLKAYHLVATDFAISPVHIHLHKVVPIGAGLGGGSSDAAFTVKMLNEMFQLSLTEDAMESYCRKIGSDCAFFVKNKPVVAYGKGDVFKNVEVKAMNAWLVLVNPGIHISTAEAYAGVTPASKDKNIEDVLSEGITSWKSSLKNDFESSIFPKYDAIKELKEKLYDLGAIYASMTGSGSTVFGIFGKEISIKDSLPKDYQIWIGKSNLY